MNKIALAIHGGAGTILRSSMTAELEAEYKSGLETALRVGRDILQHGGSALDAVEETVCSLEGFHLFNAGHGAVFTSEGKNELDASIMDGKTLRAGAVAFVRNIKNPIRLARLVMERTEHVLLAGDGANKFAEQMGVELVDDLYFFTEHRWKQLQEAIAAGRVQLDHSGVSTAEVSEPGAVAIGFPKNKNSANSDDVYENTLNNLAETRPVGSVPSEGRTETTKSHEKTRNKKEISNPQSSFRTPHSKGTVGAVACDANGSLAAATSTGGMTNKKFGRVGDTALIGSGTYAENLTCAVSCTGHGEFFMLGVTAYDVAARMKYKQIGLEEAGRETIEHLTEIGGEGGLIAVDALGNVTLPFNSAGMYRGYVTNDDLVVDIYR